MKKIFILFIILIMTLFLFTACYYNETELKTGKYTLVVQENNEIPDFMLPFITITDENFTFVYDLLSSYLNYGTYKIADKILILTTSDKKYTYSFKIDRDCLVFIEDKSDSVGLIDKRLGVKVLDGSVFKFTE